MAAGLINGSILLFDRRQPRLPLERLSGTDWLGTKPVHSLDFFESSTVHLAAANRDHAFAWPWNGLNISMNVENTNDYLLCKSPSGNCIANTAYQFTDRICG
jgi:hypothetical protein